LIFWVFASKLI